MESPVGRNAILIKDGGRKLTSLGLIPKLMIILNRYAFHISIVVVDVPGSGVYPPTQKAMFARNTYQAKLAKDPTNILEKSKKIWIYMMNGKMPRY